MSSEPVLVVGASRGIGAELVRQYLASGNEVHATVRDAATPASVFDPDGDLILHELDVRDAERTSELASRLAGSELAVVIHSAGVNQGFRRAEMMEVNASAPIRVIESLLDAGAVRSRGVVALMTSQRGARQGRSGSLGDYGDSKEALNSEFRRRAGAWGRKGVISIVVHPGWVRTDMGGASAPLSAEESATGVRRLIDGLTPDQHGRFWTWDGREHPW
jgi:NAD(P)-dependent dehydrogenase (short-subunit alcohol dehydrogenase family)